MSPSDPEWPIVVIAVRSDSTQTISDAEPLTPATEETDN